MVNDDDDDDDDDDDCLHGRDDCENRLHHGQHPRRHTQPHRLFRQHSGSPICGTRTGLASE